MYSEIFNPQVYQCFKLNFATILFLLAVMLPYLKWINNNSGNVLINKFTNAIEIGPNQTMSQLPFDNYLEVLSKKGFSGTWLSSIKQSKLLSHQNGTIKIRAQQKKLSQSNTEYTLYIKIYDGGYEDNGYYEIQLQSSSIKTKQQFASHHLIYETISPMIGLHRHGRIFTKQKQKPIYINKIKFRLILNQTLKIQLLLAAEYDINIITQPLQQKWQLLHQLILAILIFVQVLVTAIGCYCLVMEVVQQNLIANTVSPTTVKLCIAFDTAELFALCNLIYHYNMTLLVFPAYFLFMLIIYAETYLLQKIQPVKQNPSQNKRLRSPQSQGIRINNQQISTQEQQQTLLLTKSLQPLLNVVQRNQYYLMCIISYLIFYLNNMQNYIYIVYFLILMVPQIVRNIRTGNKVNYQFQSMLAFAYPRLLPILFLRFFGLKSITMLEPKYMFCLTILIMSLLSCFLLFVQTKYGSRSILPKFLIPKGFKTKFRFFTIQDQNINCIICRSQLSALPTQLINKSKNKDDIIYNKVVLTPCHHKFHAFCLEKWMESRFQCPSCSCNLPPVQQNL